MAEKLKVLLKRANPKTVISSLVYSVLAVTAICCCSLYSAKNPDMRFTAIILSAFLYIVLCVVFRLISEKTHLFYEFGTDNVGGMLAGNVTLDFLEKLHIPTVLSDEKGRIVWYNDAFSKKTKSAVSLYGKRVDGYTDVAFEQISACSSAGIDVCAFDETYSVKCYRIASHSKNYIFSVFEDKSELLGAYRELEDKNIIFSYIVIDNLEEIFKYVQDKNRLAAGDVYEILRAWAESAEGFIKEYEREKYIFLFNAEHLKEFEESKFDVLDKIREIRVGSASVPITVSVGISGKTGTLSEKEQSAQSALDMALQRGGDQVVVKTETGMDFYGGKTKTVQKRAKVHARVIADELVLNMSGSSNVMIMGHKNPDFDSFGACVGMARLAMFCGVKCNIIIDTQNTTVKKCFDKVRTLPDYRDIFVSALEAQDMLRADTFLVIVDVNNPSQFEAPDVAENAKNIAIIDHHRRNGEYDFPLTVSHIEPPASSACELVAEILEQALPAGYLAKEEADMMYTGIMLDTKQFTKNVGNRTFGAALFLKNEGASPVDTQNFFKSSLNDFLRESKFESSAEIYRKISVIAIAESTDDSDEDRVAAAKAADRLLMLDGISASFVLCCFADEIHISARSSGSVNVQIILEKIGGGGHFDAAAVRISEKTPEEVTEMLKRAIDDYLDS